jgi:NAD(P)-dependent dehydrogenase (short-subunit alcohol dehydrogenase family)
VTLRVQLAGPVSTGALSLAHGGGPGILEALARALRERGHEVAIGASPSGEPLATSAIVLQDATRRAVWLLGGDVPDRLRDWDAVAAATAELRTRLRRARAIASKALFTIPLAPLGPPDPAPGDPQRVAFVGYRESERSALGHLANGLRRVDPRLHPEVLAVGASPAEATDAGLAVVVVETVDELLARLPGYGFVVAGGGPIGVSDVGLLSARRAGAIVLTHGTTAGRHELVLHEYDGFVSEELEATPAFVEECVRHITALANDPVRAGLFRKRARRDSPGWDEIARLWERALRATAPPARVTVVMSAYNVEPFVEDAVDSVLAQTYRDFDLVVVDDGSTDGTTDLLRGLHDPRLLVVEQPNAGVWAALNTGLRHAHRELVARMDADDLTHPRRLALEVDFLDRHPHVGLLGTGFYKIDRDGRILMLVHYPTDDRALKRQLTRENAFLHPTVVFRRAILDQTGPYRRHEAEDYDLWLRMSERVTVANLEAPLHRLRRTGQTRVAQFEREIIASADELRREALARCLGGEDSAGYPVWRRPRWLGLPALHAEERAPYAETLQSWAETRPLTEPGLAARLYAKAVVTRPLEGRAWRGLARSVFVGQPLAWVRRRLLQSR